MPLEHASWVLPAIEAAIKHPDELLSVWEKINAYLLGKKSLIGITGMPGIGKSVLLEHLTGEAFALGHPLPVQPSPNSEEGKVLSHKKRIRLVTIPGQENRERFNAATRVFEGKKAVAGVLHVVANGYATVRNKPFRAALVKSGVQSVRQYRDYNLKEEIADLRRTCAMVQRSILKHHESVWMIVVATKCDLYSDELDAAESYYSPYGNNEFVKELNALSEAVGSLNFNWDSVPLCASLEDAEWNGQIVPSSFKQSQRDQLITALLRRIDRNCATR
jgi:GTPase SAR1 family protein